MNANPDIFGIFPVTVILAFRYVFPICYLGISPGMTE